MAVSISAADLAAAMRVGNSTTETAQVTRLLAFATTVVTDYAASAPDDVHNEAVIRLSAYLYDAPFSAANGQFANAFRSSGAESMLSRYRKHRAGVILAWGDLQVTWDELLVTWGAVQ